MRGPANTAFSIVVSYVCILGKVATTDSCTVDIIQMLSKIVQCGLALVDDRLGILSLKSLSSALSTQTPPHRYLPQ